VERGWSIVVAAARLADRLAAAGTPAAFVAEERELRPVRVGDPSAVLSWTPETGFEPLDAIDDFARAVLELYLPICSATARRPLTLAHLGQSLDGFIATHTGDSRWVTGEENVKHMHRLRALCDAVIVGAGTVAMDDPQLTTRLVEGQSPVRVVLDPSRRLAAAHRVFTDDSAPTLYVCAKSLVRDGDRCHGAATIVGVPEVESGWIDLAEVVRLLRARGCARLFVEGGGVTVSGFLEANLLDRLHVTVAPLLIGDGRPAIRLPARAALGDCHRPRYRVFRMGGDVLFDCELRSEVDNPGTDANLTRVI
jgi:riboflavin-specific deaminase-like protein